MAHKNRQAAHATGGQATILALALQDEFSRLKEAHQAQACINSLLSPHQLPTLEQPEEFSVTPEDLRALLRVTQGEVERRAGAGHLWPYAAGHLRAAQPHAPLVALESIAPRRPYLSNVENQTAAFYIDGSAARLFESPRCDSVSGSKLGLAFRIG